MIVSGGEEAVSGERRGRVDAVDCARGLALIGMAAYHLSWDLADFRFVPPMFPFSPAMRLLSHGVASAFLALVGVSLALAHRHRLNWSAYWRRLAMIAAAAFLVTVASLFFSPGAPIFFGILQCIVAASLVAAPFVEAPAWTSLAVGAAAIAVPYFMSSTLFDRPALLWIGLGEALPNTLDWRPLLPWAGVVLIGLGLARLPGALAWLTAPGRWRAGWGVPWALGFAGRHSLIVYLVHQPLLIGALYAATHWAGLAPKPDMSGFLASCQRACVERGREAAECDMVCRCVADVIERSGEADRLSTLDQKRKDELKRFVDACRSQ